MANVVLPGESGSGRLHLDSMTRQAKAFFLNDVHERNGPFQYATSVVLTWIALVVNDLTGENRLGAIVVAPRDKNTVLSPVRPELIFTREPISLSMLAS